MKIRNGFVSNSSSSSFVVVGIKLESLDYDSPEYAKYEEKYSIEQLGDGVIVGYSVCAVDEYGVEDTSLQEVEKIIKAAKDDFPDQDVRLYAGTTYG